jgi:hypothetical protein
MLSHLIRPRDMRPAVWFGWTCNFKLRPRELGIEQPARAHLPGAQSFELCGR